MLSPSTQERNTGFIYGYAEYSRTSLRQERIIGVGPAQMRELCRSALTALYRRSTVKRSRNEQRQQSGVGEGLCTVLRAVSRSLRRPRAFVPVATRRRFQLDHRPFLRQRRLHPPSSRYLQRRPPELSSIDALGAKHIASMSASVRDGGKLSRAASLVGRCCQGSTLRLV
jgi:hypothetical protein